MQPANARRVLQALFVSSAALTLSACAVVRMPATTINAPDFSQYPKLEQQEADQGRRAFNVEVCHHATDRYGMHACAIAAKLFYAGEKDSTDLSDEEKSMLIAGKAINDNPKLNYCEPDAVGISCFPDYPGKEVTKSAAPPSPITVAALPPVLDHRTESTLTTVFLEPDAKDSNHLSNGSALVGTTPKHSHSLRSHALSEHDTPSTASPTPKPKTAVPAIPRVTSSAAPKIVPPANDNSMADWIKLIFGTTFLGIGIPFNGCLSSNREQRQSKSAKFRAAAFEVTSGVVVGAVSKYVAGFIVAHTALAIMPGVVALAVVSAATGAAVGVWRNRLKAKSDRKDWRAAAVTGALFGLGGGLLFAGAGGLLGHLFSHASNAVTQHGSSVVKAAVQNTTTHVSAAVATHTAAQATQTAAANIATNIQSVLTPDQLHSLSPELQKLALSKSPKSVAQFCELAARHLMSGQDHNSASFKAGVALMKQGAQIVNNVNDHSTWSRDIAKMAFRGFGMDKSKDAAIAYAKHIGGKMGEKLLQSFAPQPA